MPEKESWFSDVTKKVVVTLAVTAILAVLGWLSGLLKAAWDWSWQSHEVQGWIIIVLSLCTLFFIVIIFTRIRANTAEQKRLEAHRKAQFEYLAYKSDIFYEILWRWEYTPSGDIDDNSIICFCRDDDTTLVYQDIQSPFRALDDIKKVAFCCETCGKQSAIHDGTVQEVIRKVRRQIERKIRTGEWKQATTPRAAAHIETGGHNVE
jgi:hypothetical protein